MEDHPFFMGKTHSIPIKTPQVPIKSHEIPTNPHEITRNPHQILENSKSYKNSPAFFRSDVKVSVKVSSLMTSQSSGGAGTVTVASWPQQFSILSGWMTNG